MEKENPFDPQKLIWIGLIALLVFGLGVVFLRPPEAPVEEQPTPGPSPELASLQCLDGAVYRSIDELTGQPREDGFPVRGHWTITFADGGYVFDQVGVHEAGRYRCDGNTLLASSALGSHRGQLDVAGRRLAWDGQGFEVVSSAPKTTTTSG